MLRHLAHDLHDFALLNGVVIGQRSPGPHVPTDIGNFDLVVKHRLNVPPYTTIAKWRSRETGMKVVWADTPGPVSKFWATVVTEVFDSRGEPHTLEHLTFTASKHFKYSGILDALANRMYTAGSNAATDVDNTTYTVESCSEQGLLTIIPVYLDHILFPLTDQSIFKTEVYHVDGKGEEGGVVFSEMQGREGSQDDVMERALSDILYNVHNAYRSQTGGQLDALRKLTLADINAFHQKAYAPQNLTVIVTGEAIRPVRLLQTIDSTVEVNLKREGLANGPRPRGWIRPLVESSTAKNPPVIIHDIVKKVEYRELDESVGTIQITWIGLHVHDWLTCAALEVLAHYLAGNSSSPLSKLFVETATPACSGITFSTDFRSPTLLNVSLSAVPADQLPHLGADFLDALEHLAHEHIDMNRLWGGLKNKWLTMLQMLETDADSYVQASIMQDVLYGAEDGRDFSDAFNDLHLMRKLMLWTPSDWHNLLKTWYIKPHNITLIGTPAATLVKQNDLANKARVSLTKKRLGKTGLAALEVNLEKAKANNEHPAPPSVTEAFRIPADDIAWQKVETARSNGAGRGRETFHNALQEKINRDHGGALPYFVQFDHFESNFVSVSAFLHGSPLPIFPLWSDSFFSMPLRRRDGSLLSFEKTMRKLSHDSISHDASMCEEGLLITIKTVKKDYAKAIRWLSDIIYGTQYDFNRLRNLVNSSLESLPSQKEDGSAVALAALNEMFFSSGSFMGVSNIQKLESLYPKLKKRLGEDPKSVIKDLEEMRHAMVDPRAMRVSVRGDVLGLEHPVTDWLTHFEHVPAFPPHQLAPVPVTRDLLTPLGRSPSKKGIVVSVPTSDSTYLFVRAKAPRWTHPDYAAIDLASSLLSAMNGPLWKSCRGSGLCYGVSIAVADAYGNITLEIFKSPDAFAAFEAAKSVVEGIAAGTQRIAQTDVDAAKSSMVFERVSGQNTTTSAAFLSFYQTVLHDRPDDYTRRCLQRIKAVTPDDVERVVRDWISPLFQADKSIFGASANREKTKAVAAAFTKLGYDVEQRQV